MVSLFLKHKVTCLIKVTRLFISDYMTSTNCYLHQSFQFQVSVGHFLHFIFLAELISCSLSTFITASIPYRWVGFLYRRSFSGRPVHSIDALTVFLVGAF